MAEIQVVGDAVDQLVLKPNPKQAEFFAVPTTIKEVLFGGAAGPGKTWALLMDPIMRRLHNHPRFHGILFRETFPQIEESLELESNALYPHVGGRYDGQEHAWHFESGAVIRFSYLAKDEQVYDHDTAQYNYAGYDELTAFTRMRYMYIVHSRTRTTVKGLPAYSRAATNPLGIGHSWVKERFVDPAPTGSVVIREVLPIIDPNTGEKAVVKRMYIPAKVTDNPLIMKENPEYINSLMLLPEAEKKSKLYGDWNAVAGQVFMEFRREHMIDEPENAVHVIPPFEIPSYWPVLLAIDWGYDAITWAGFLAISPEEIVYLCREFSAHKTKIKVWASDLGRLCDLYPSLRTPASLDRSAFGDRGDEKTIAEQVEEGLGFPVERSDSDRIGGKLLLHEYLRWRPKPVRYVPPEGYDLEVEQKIFRIRGERAAADYRKVFEPEPPERNLPRYRIFNTCPLAIDAILAATSDPKKPEDVLAWNGDDPYDGQRYGLKRVHRFFDESQSAYKSLVRKDAIIERLRQTGDMTSFYQEMDKLESDNAIAQGPVRRYNRIRTSRSFRVSRSYR